jgi:hypothetical protein
MALADPPLEWVLVDGIKVARPRLRAALGDVLTDADVAQMIACPTCLAKVCESCRTASGNSTEHHLRLVPRRCRCGGLLEPKRTYCDPCGDVARKQTYYRREEATPTRLRRRKRVT